MTSCLWCWWYDPEIVRCLYHRRWNPLKRCITFYDYGDTPTPELMMYYKGKDQIC